MSSDIKFIVETPRENFLNFLDVSIGLNNNQLEYKWYTKDMHSGISLNKQSWLPHHIKTNYITNSKKTVTERCSDQNYHTEAIAKLHRRFKNNGFTNRDIAVRPKNKNRSNDNHVTFKINFVSDTCNRKLNKLIKECDLPIKLVNKPGPTLAKILNNKNKKM